jgi:hypothetical protein
MEGRGLENTHMQWGDENIEELDTGQYIHTQTQIEIPCRNDNKRWYF